MNNNNFKKLSGHGSHMKGSEDLTLQFIKAEFKKNIYI